MKIIGSALALAATVAGCLPFPSQSPRVESGLGVNLLGGERVTTEHDSAVSRYIVPEQALGLTLGTAQSGGRGWGIRGSVLIDVASGETYDSYVQLPSAGIGPMGVGVLWEKRGAFTGAIAPYAAVGWNLSDTHMLYLAQSVMAVRATDSTPRRTASATVIGLQTRRERPIGNTDQHLVGAARYFLAFFLGGEGTETTTRLSLTGDGENNVPTHSIVAIGVALDITLPWVRPGRPPGR